MSEKNILRSNKPPVTNPCKTVGEYFWKLLVQLDDDHVCAIDARTDEKLTIGSLKRQSNSIAVALLKRRVINSDVITFYGPSTIQHTVLRFVAYFLGLTFMPLSPTFEKYEVEQEYTSSGANIIFTSARDLHKFERITEDSIKNRLKLVVVFDCTHENFLTFEQLLEEGRNQSLERIPHFDIDPDKDMLYLVHTSGSTGYPKCAMIPHRHILLNGEESLQFTGAVKGSVVAMVFPFGHISGTTMIPLHIVFGTTVILFGDFNEELLLKSIDKYKVTILPIFPSIGRQLIEGDLVGQYNLSSVQIISTGGASFPGNIAQQLIDKYGIQFREVYGMTECAIMTCTADPEDGFIPGNCGRVVTGIDVKFADLNTGEAVSPNIEGEICVKGSKFFCGYLSKGVVSREAFDSEGWYRSGDLGYYDEKGRIFIKDRLKEVVRIGVGDHYINISPVEIELFLLTHESIAEVAVVGVNNKSGTHWPRAYVLLKEGKISTEEDIQKFLSDTLAYTKQLKGGVVFVDSIQRTSIGKVDRKHYRNLVKDEVID